MLLAMMDYAAKLYSNLSATTTADPTITTTTTTMPTITTTTKLPPHNAIFGNTITNNTTTTPTATTPTIAKSDTFNATVKSIVKNTLIKVAKTNMADYTAQYSLPPDALGPDPHGGVDVGSSGGGRYSGTNAMQATRSDQVGSFPTQTVATFIAGNKNRATTIIVYPTVSPESIVIPIVSCIFGFPILALIVICCLRRRAKLARERDRRRNYDMQDHAVSLVRFSPIHRLNYRSSRAISLRPERSLSQGFTSLELDTVMEERSDIEQTQTEILNAESPLETTSLKMSFSS